VLIDKKIIVGITGSIAAYKAAILIRLLVKEGAVVKAIMTPTAQEFITPVTIATLSRNTVLSDFFRHDDGEWNNHVELGIWADLLLIAPATANTVAKMANGVCDNLLLTTYLSARCPVFVAPAMDKDMINHPATLMNIKALRSYGNIIIEPSAGELASGLYGKGRMEEPEMIIKKLTEYFNTKCRFSGKKVLITAGPTYENIDPVRFIANYSSGKMGYALAEEFARQGAGVTLISGPTSLEITHPGIELIKIVSAEQMYNAASEHFPENDITIMAAAVCDYSPVDVSALKLKSRKENISLLLAPTIDIAATLGKHKKSNQLLIGFALETDNETCNATQKLRDKNLDMIILNSLKDEGAGFQCDTNKITIIERSNKITAFELKNKQEVAKDIAEKIASLILFDS
jgi:phosphopantothenoylcysteine decarboxylase/phosphopantothenate--cysteine ligase